MEIPINRGDGLNLLKYSSPKVERIKSETIKTD